MTQWLEQKFTSSHLFEAFSTLDFLFHIHLKIFKGNMHLKTELTFLPPTNLSYFSLLSKCVFVTSFDFKHHYHETCQTVFLSRFRSKISPKARDISQFHFTSRLKVIQTTFNKGLCREKSFKFILNNSCIKIHEF